MASAPTPQPSGVDIMAENAKAQQLHLMGSVRLLLVTALTCTPPPSGMPVEVRKFVFNQLQHVAKLFAPRGTEEEVFYGTE